VPKASVYENHCFVLWQYYIRLARQFLFIQPVPETVGKQKPPHQSFGLGILIADTAHIVTAGSFVVYVGH